MKVMRFEIRSGCAAELPLYCTFVVIGSLAAGQQPGQRRFAASLMA
jgi:hypothetical protein